MKFLGAMNEKKMMESVEVLAEISKFSLDFYKKLSIDSSKKFGFDSKGLLLVSADDAGLQMAELEMKLMAEKDIPGKMMTKEELLAFEPTLKPLVKGGVFFPNEAHVEPFETTSALFDSYLSLGGKAKSEVEVIDFKMSDNKITEVLTTQGTIKAKTVVLAAGSWSKKLADNLGCKIPLLGGKGYSMSVEGDFVKPKRPIMIVEKKIAITPYAKQMRIAGTLELVDQDFDFSPRRVSAIEKGAREYLHMEGAMAPKNIWRGLRPCTPDGVPLIGYSEKLCNLFYCVGHQMLGLQSAPGSAKLAADIIQGRTPYVNPKPFRPGRYER
jgi:D-amino-acid dehydrogenase